MASRPIFAVLSGAPYRAQYTVEFDWNSGLSVSQKQKNVKALHEAFTERYPEKKVLEISSKSMQEGGAALSAFNLKKFVPSLGRSVPVEMVYHAGKVFRNGGPYTDLLDGTPREAKKDDRLKNSGAIVGFRYEGRDFPTRPQSAFYDYLYVNALLENEDLAKIVLQYDAFTDIEFNPQKSISCQAKAAALFVSLTRLGLIEKVREFDDFLGLIEKKPETAARPSAGVPKPVQKEPAAPKEVPGITVGSVIVHRVWQEGTVVSVNGGAVRVNFASVGEKTLGMSWILDNCEIAGQGRTET